MVNKTQKSPSEPSRRAFLRNSMFAGLACVTAKLAAKTAREVCVNDGFCKSCLEFDDCGLPRALSVKQTTRKTAGG